MGVPRNPLLDRLEDVEMERLLALEFVGAVTGANGGGQRIATGRIDELHRFIGIGQTGIPSSTGDVFLDASEHAQFRFDVIPWRVPVRPPGGDLDIFSNDSCDASKRNWACSEASRKTSLSMKGMPV